MHTTKRLIFFLVIIWQTYSFSQNQFNAEFDCSVFSFDDSSYLLEVYYSFYQPGMKVLEENNQKIISGVLKVSIENTETNNKVLDKEWNFSSEIDSINQEKNLIGLLRFPIEHGKYFVKIVGKDLLDQTKSSSREFEIALDQNAEDLFSISGLQIATSIKQYNVDTASIFYKNTLEILPNPGLVFGKELPVLYFYCELNNIDKDVQSELLKIEHNLYSVKNDLKYSKTKYIPRNNASIVEIGAINISKLPTGIYNLVVNASDTLKNHSVVSEKKIFVYNSDIMDSTSYIAQGISEILESEFAIMSEEELDNNFSVSKYIASPNEVDNWEKLSEIEPKRKYLVEFWKKRDTSPETPQNETKIEFFTRVEYSNNNFKSLIQKKGWRSDKGRVYVLFGPPSEIERHPYEVETKPYEIWYYNEIEGGVIFVFSDYSGFSDYRLIHSDKRGELADQNWYDSIRQN